MSTNPTYLGSDKQIDIDSLIAYKGYKVLALSSWKSTQYQVHGPHYPELTSLFYDTAKCGAGKTEDHEIAQCSCGFYSYDNTSRAGTHWVSAALKKPSMAIATVALSGQVVICEKGYRSQKQRVTHLTYPGCFRCKNTAETLVSHYDGSYVPSCHSCINEYIEKTTVKRWWSFGKTKEKTLDTLSFQELSERFSPEGYEPIKVDSDPGFFKVIEQIESTKDYIPTTS